MPAIRGTVDSLHGVQFAGLLLTSSLLVCNQVNVRRRTKVAKTQIQSTNVSSECSRDWIIEVWTNSSSAADLLLCMCSHCLRVSSCSLLFFPLSTSLCLLTCCASYWTLMFVVRGGASIQGAIQQHKDTIDIQGWNMHRNLPGSAAGTSFTLVAFAYKYKQSNLLQQR
jgi:hypothetical protein